MANQENKKKPAFSIMEVIIAIFILTVGILGAMKLIASTMKNSMDIRNQLIASGLAQEGLELVRNVRDNNLLSISGLPFQTPSFPADSDSSCIVDISSDSLNCAGNPSTNLYLSGNNFYIPLSMTPGETATPFKRNISIIYDGGAAPNFTGANIISTVWWSSEINIPGSCNLASQCIQAQSYLADKSY